MNLKHDWINSLLIALTLTLCMFIVVDITYNEQMWEFSPFAFKTRLQAMGITVVTFFSGSYIYQRIARHFINKSKDKKKASWKEYVLVFLINFVLLNITHTFIQFYVNLNDTFKWGESALISSIVSILYAGTQWNFIQKLYRAKPSTGKG